MPENLDIGAEDQFGIYHMVADNSLLPGVEQFEILGQTATLVADRWNMVFDFRLVENLYNDHLDALEAYGPVRGRPHLVLASRANEAWLREALTRVGHPYVIEIAEHRNLDVHPFNLTELRDVELETVPQYGAAADEADFRMYAANLLANGSRYDEPDYFAEYEHLLQQVDLSKAQDGLTAEEILDLDQRDYEWVKDTELARTSILDSFLERIRSRSLLGQLLMVNDGRWTHVIPYSGTSLHHLYEEGSSEQLVRPSRFDRRYAELFGSDLRELEALVNQPKVREKDLERLLLSNPLFLRGLNYRRVYPQVVLDRPGQRSLIPDIIAEPVDSEWVDIIELKRPDDPLLVGSERHRYLAAAITRVASQIQDYSRYFDNNEWREIAEKKYGFKCSNPRLVVIIGRDPGDYVQRELRERLSMYPRLQVVTWDAVVRAARSLPFL